MSNLERRYRTLLKVLPGWYRRDREEEMVGIFLADRTDDLDLEYGWPGWSETGAMLGLAVRTRLSAGNAPGGVMWLGDVVRALGVLGLLLGVFYAAASMTNAVRLHDDAEFTSMVTWVRAFDVLPIVAFVALLSGRRTLSKVVAFVAVMPVGGILAPGWSFWWLLFSLPSMATFLCLCLGFHRDAPTPPVRRLAWWGGGALSLGVGGGLLDSAIGGLVAVVVGVAIARAVAYWRGEVVVGRALSLFAVLMLVPVAVLAQAVSGGERMVVPALVAAALLVASAAAPVVRRARVRGFRLL